MYVIQLYINRLLDRLKILISIKYISIIRKEIILILMSEECTCSYPFSVMDVQDLLHWGVIDAYIFKSSPLKKIKRTKLKYHILERYIFTNSWFSFIGIHQNSLFVPHACLHMLGPGGWWRFLSSKLSESSLKKSVLFFFEKYKRKRLNFHGKKGPFEFKTFFYLYISTPFWGLSESFVWCETSKFHWVFQIFQICIFRN